MKVHKFTVYVYDHDDYGPEEAAAEIENIRNVVSAIFPHGSADVGEWDDNHPLNRYKGEEDFAAYHFKKHSKT